MITKSEVLALSKYMAQKYAAIGITNIDVNEDGDIVITYADGSTSIMSSAPFMVREVYDAFNRGKVDMAQDSEKLGGQIPSFYTNSGNINYDNTLSGLTADDVKAAIDEIVNIIETLPTPALSAGVVQTPTYADNGNGTVTMGACTVNLFTSTNFVGDIKQYSIAGGTFTPTNNSNSYLVVNYNNGAPIYQILNSVTLINESTIIPVYSFYRKDNYILRLNWDTLGVGLSNKIHQRLVFTQRFARESGLALSELPTRVISVGSGVVWHGAVRDVLDAVVSNVDECHFYRHVGGVWGYVNATQYNNTQYDNGTDLVTLTNGRYTINWIYRNVEDGKHIEYVLSDQQYAQLASAIEAQPRNDLPDAIKSNALLIGRIIVRKNEDTASNIASAFDVTFVTAPINNHNDLASLQGGEASQYYHLTAQQHDDTIATRFWALLGVPTDLTLTTAYQKVINLDTTKIPSVTSDYFALSTDKKDITCTRTGTIRITRTIGIDSITEDCYLTVIPTINGTQTATCLAQEQTVHVDSVFDKNVGYSYYLTVNANDVVSLWVKSDVGATLSYTNVRTTVEYI